MVFAEARRVVRRLDVQLASRMALMQMALSTQPNMNVKPAASQRIAKAFEKVLKGMLDG